MPGLAGNGAAVSHRIIDSDGDCERLCTLLRGLKKPFTVEWSPGRDRSLDQNRLQFLWAREVAEQRGDVTADEVRREWKLIYAVPIMRECSEAFRKVYDAVIKPIPSYELKMQAMHFIPVTSEMTVPQMVQYLDTIQRESLQAGFQLTDPDPMLAAHNKRYRETAGSPA